MSTTTIWIVAAVVAVLALIVLVVVVSKAGNRRRHRQAEVKAAEAARLQEQAATHQSHAATSREQLQEQWDRADGIDPKSAKQKRDAVRSEQDAATAAEYDSQGTPVEASYLDAR